MKSILFAVTLISLAKIAGGCCCSLRWDYFNCGCNFFNCDCKTVDGYCQYTTRPLETDHCFSHPKELCARRRVIELEGNDTSGMHGPMDIYNLLDKNRDGYVSRKELWNSVYHAQQFIEPKQKNAGSLQDLLAKVYSQGTFNITFEQLDLNENGKIDPGEIDESLEDQIKHRSIKEEKKRIALLPIKA